MGALPALSELETADRRQDEPARKQPEQEWHNLDAETGQHGAFVGHQPAIPCLRDIGCGDIQDRGIASSRRMASLNDST